MMMYTVAVVGSPAPPETYNTFRAARAAALAEIARDPACNVSIHMIDPGRRDPLPVAELPGDKI